MEQGQMIKAMAKLEGIDLIWHRNMHLRKDRQGNFCINGVTMGVYNPLESYALTYKAMVDYKVQKTTSMTNHSETIFSIRGGGVAVRTQIESDFPLAIIECILKSKGLWEV